MTMQDYNTVTIKRKTVLGQHRERKAIKRKLEKKGYKIVTVSHCFFNDHFEIVVTAEKFV